MNKPRDSQTSSHSSQYTQSTQKHAHQDWITHQGVTRLFYQLSGLIRMRFSRTQIVIMAKTWNVFLHLSKAQRGMILICKDLFMWSRVILHVPPRRTCPLRTDPPPEMYYLRMAQLAPVCIYWHIVLSHALLITKTMGKHLANIKHKLYSSNHIRVCNLYWWDIT